MWKLLVELTIFSNLLLIHCFSSSTVLGMHLPSVKIENQLLSSQAPVWESSWLPVAGGANPDTCPFQRPVKPCMLTTLSPTTVYHSLLPPDLLLSPDGHLQLSLCPDFRPVHPGQPTSTPSAQPHLRPTTRSTMQWMEMPVFRCLAIWDSILPFTPYTNRKIPLALAKTMSHLHIACLHHHPSLQDH